MGHGSSWSAWLARAEVAAYRGWHIEAPEEPDLYDEVRELCDPLPSLAPGVLVEELTTYQETSAPFEGGRALRFFWPQSVPVYHVRLIVRAPYVGVSTGRFWAEVAKRYGAIVEEQL